MSKTTILLLACLLIFVGILLFFVYGEKNNSFVTTITTPIRSIVIPSNTSLSFSTNTPFIQPGQTATIAVIIHSPNPQPSLVQLEISYNPSVITVDSLTPGSFFTNPDIALQKIDPLAGRISYALHCPTSDTTDSGTDCINKDSSTVALIVVTSTPYAFNHTTTLTFLPKTVVRTRSGRDILQGATGLELTIGKNLYPVASSSAFITPNTNYIRVTPNR